MKDFFISYNQADRPFAEWIAWQLKSAGYSVVIQAWDFREGSNFVIEMDQAIKDTARTLVVLSPDFLASRFTAPEWAAAFATDPTGQARKLVPVRVRPCTPGGLLAQISYIDLVGLASEEAARERLLRGVSPNGVPDTPPALPPLGEAPAAILPAAPPWPPAIAVIGHAAESLARRAVRMAGTLFVTALLVKAFLSVTLPYAAEQSAGTLYSVSVVLGLLAVALVEAALLFKRGRPAGATRGPQGTP